jgi:serine/threonine-protein kinase
VFATIRAMSRHPTARTGKRLGRYRIEAELGRGGMGVVYVATDENTGRRLALKTTTVAGLGSGEKTRNQRRERFIREVRALTQVNHENVVHVFDAGEVDDPDLGWLLYYTMDYVEGTTLASLVQERGALSPGEASAVVMQVAAGLGEAHRQGIIHRDVKPANIFLSNDGRALIGDFGIAKIEGSTQITRRDQLVGTPNYLAPEQILGEAVGPPTDVFALGALFYVITQNRPLRQQVDAAALLASANGNEPVQRTLATTLPDGLKRVVARCLEREPSRRYVDGAAFADALADFATRVPALRDSPPAPAFLAEGTADRSSAFSSDTQSVPDAAPGDLQGLPDAAPDAPMTFGNDVDSVEAMAKAMLGEVERRSTGMFKAPPRAPLPVARTEPTAMFNLRAMEAAATTTRSSSSSSSSLPVARSEPENPFGGLGGAGFPASRPASGPLKRPAITLERVTDDDAGMPAPQAVTSSSSTPPPPATAPRAAASPAASTAASPAPSPAPRPAPPPAAPSPPPSPSPPSSSVARRPGEEPPDAKRRGDADAHDRVRDDVDDDVADDVDELVDVDPQADRVDGDADGAGEPGERAGETDDVGRQAETRQPAPLVAPSPARPARPPPPRHVLVAAALAAGFVFGIVVAVAARPASREDEFAVVRRPDVCPAQESAADAVARGTSMLEEARAQKAAGMPKQRVIEKLRAGIAADPTSVQLFYELGQVTTDREQEDAYDCVCQIAPESRECRAVEKVRHP